MRGGDAVWTGGPRGRGTAWTDGPEGADPGSGAGSSGLGIRVGSAGRDHARGGRGGSGGGRGDRGEGGFAKSDVYVQMATTSLAVHRMEIRRSKSWFA